MQTVSVYSRLEGYYGSCRSIVLVRNRFTDLLRYFVERIDLFRPSIEPGMQFSRLYIQRSASIVTA